MNNSRLSEGSYQPPGASIQKSASLEASEERGIGSSQPYQDSALGGHASGGADSAASAHTRPAPQYRVVSLRFGKRAERDRIQRENQRIAKRILEAQATIRSRDFERDFRRHQKISSGLQMIAKNRQLFANDSGPLLPPLNQSASGSQTIEHDGESFG